MTARPIATTVTRGRIHARDSSERRDQANVDKIKPMANKTLRKKKVKTNN